MSQKAKAYATETVNFKYLFTQDERNENAAKLTTHMGEKGRLEANKKSVVSEYKALIDREESEIRIAQQHVHDGYTYKDIVAKKVPDFESRQWCFIHPETGEIIKTRDFVPGEQLPMEGMEEEPQSEHPVEDGEYKEVRMIGGPTVIIMGEGDDQDSADQNTDTDEPDTDK